jgi:sugar (pentulose or hexulose) kinase
MPAAPCTGSPPRTTARIARAILEGLAFASRDVAQRLVALGLPAHDVVVLAGGGQSRVWTQIRADALGLPHRAAARTDTSAVGAAMIAAVAAGALRDLHSAAALAPAHSAAVIPQRSLDEPYDRYRRLVSQLAPLADQPWA